MTGRGHEAGSPSRETTELRQEHEPRTQAVAASSTVGTPWPLACL